MRRILGAIAAAAIALSLMPAAGAAVTYTVRPAASIATSSSTLTVTAGATSIRCVASFSGTLNSSFTDTAGSSLGSLSGATLTGCGSGLTLGIGLRSLWPIRLLRILGFYPFESGALVQRTALLWFTVLGNTCHYQGDILSLAPISTLLNGDRAFGTWTTLGSNFIPLIAGPAACPAVAYVTTSFPFTVLQKVSG